ncbi:hypothetical protein JHK85_039503 [Glycine max]|nr:hypothetical protein JHK85_039503 [Glycine max]
MAALGGFTDITGAQNSIDIENLKWKNKLSLEGSRVLTLAVTLTLDKDRSVGYFSCFSSDIDTPSSATVMSTFCENLATSTNPPTPRHESRGVNQMTPEELNKDGSGYFSCFSSDIHTTSSATVMSRFCANLATSAAASTSPQLDEHIVENEITSGGYKESIQCPIPPNLPKLLRSKYLSNTAPIKSTLIPHKNILMTDLYEK